MKGLDTNVLLRAITLDHPTQSLVALSRLEAAEARGERFYISLPVLCELAWTLRAQPYGYDRAAIARTLEKLLETHMFEVQARATVRRAIEQYRQGNADFPDYLIGQHNLAAGCDETWTFDKKLAQNSDFLLLG